ncbi:hypothetical protein EMCRGX_G011393 [Ephydatia muelleri]
MKPTAKYESILISNGDKDSSTKAQSVFDGDGSGVTGAFRGLRRLVQTHVVSERIRILIWILMFFANMCFHLARKSFSAVKGVLKPNCSANYSTSGWEPFSGPHGNTYLGITDSSFLFTYAVFMYLSGYIADRVNTRYFLVIGMVGSGVGSILLGVAYFADIHVLYYFILVQLGTGAAQSASWPAVMAVMGHWFGKQRRGLIMGIWYMHTSIGNILGTVIPSIWATCDGPWGWSFVVPGFIIIGVSVPVFLLLVPGPEDVGLCPPTHQTTQTPLINEEVVSCKKAKPLGPLKTLMIPGVIEYSLALFFIKLVSYTFLFWLPFYITTGNHGYIGKTKISAQVSDWLATTFDMGGIIGTIVIGGLSDLLKVRSVLVVVSLVLAAPLLFLYHHFSNVHVALSVVLLIISGATVNGPYGVVATAISSDLATDPLLVGNDNAKATVAAIIDGTGSLGAAIGPLIAGAVSEYSWNDTFYILMASCLISALLLSRLLIVEIVSCYRMRHKNQRKVNILFEAQK